ncbi:MAG: hypothetical protein MJ191_06860 [Clostridium sp.]|nr:hypothetical protein [Clostridium sp.]
MIAFIIISILLLIGIIWLIVNQFKVNEMLNQFKRNNVIVAGKKGKGKDVIMQYVVKKRKNEQYYGNIDYGYNYNHVELKDMKIGENTYENFINNNIAKSPHIFYEKADFYISDGGVFLPSYMDSKLYKDYKGLPLFYALSRHLYNSNVHVNVQNFGRLWKALREQADFYVLAKRTIKLPFFLITSVYTYDNYHSAEQELKPLRSRLANKYSKAEVDIYNATHGEIKHFFIIQTKRSMKYDSRAFEKICLNDERLEYKTK